MKTSSTSSSSRPSGANGSRGDDHGASGSRGNDHGANGSGAGIPWAAILALLGLLLADRLILNADGPWQRFAIDDANSAARSWLELAELRSAPRDRTRVIVVGTSKVIDGFVKDVAERQLPGAVFAKMAYPRFEPFAIRMLIPDLIAAEPDAVVWIASELDTHRPLRLESVPGSSAASLAAIWELVQLTDWNFSIENRTSLYRLIATCAIRAYRFQLDLRLAGIDAWRVFPLHRWQRRPPKPRSDPFRPVALWGATHHKLDDAALRTTMDLFPPLMDPWDARMQSGTLQEITRGSHVRVQMALLRRSAELLREAGIQLLILEADLHPAAYDLYDRPALHKEFHDFGVQLRNDLGVLFVRPDQEGPLAESDYYDLIHTTRRGGTKLTRAILRTLRLKGIGIKAKDD